MVESVCRRLRDGVLPGEFAPSLMLLNRSSSPHSGRALLLHLLASLSSNIAAGTAQPRCIVLVAAESSPKYYQSFAGFKEDHLLGFRYVDCFVDPLGWRTLLSRHDILEEANENWPYLMICHDVRDLVTLLSFIYQSGTSAKSDTTQFSVFIDSINALLAYNSVDSVAKFLNNIRENGKVSSLVWMLHSNQHGANVVKTLEYMSSMIIAMEQLQTAVTRNAEESLQSKATKKLFSEGILKVRQKRNNGRVREQIEKFEVDQFSIKISNRFEDTEAGKLSVPKVQFRLQLSDKERQERAKVVLPFEHQGDGRENLIYDGRTESATTLLSTKKTKDDLHKLKIDDRNSELVEYTRELDDKRNSGLVEYLRDSDDERPDSDEDPDDDLDV